MIKFIQTYNDSDDKIEITLSPDSSLPDVIQTFERFLIAAGYVFDGRLDFVEEEEEMQYGTTL